MRFLLSSKSFLVIALCRHPGSRAFATIDSSPLLRLNKAMRDQNLIGSRREADELIQQGHVTVNGVAASLGAKIRSSDKIEISAVVAERPQPVTIALHKPKTFISQARNPRPGQRYAWSLLTWGNQAQSCRFQGTNEPHGPRFTDPEPNPSLDLSPVNQVRLSRSNCENLGVVVASMWTVQVANPAPDEP